MVKTDTLSVEHALNVLENIPDPDIPVISIVELGLIRGVRLQDDTLIVQLTPSYNGCPAMYFFKEEIPLKLKEAGFDQVKLEIVLSPPWSTSWLSEQTREKLRLHGIAPPDERLDESENYSGRKVTCPRCQSSFTSMKSRFGSTPCKALWYCNDCAQPFEYFKCH